MPGSRHLLASTRGAPAIVAAALLLALPAAMNGCGKPGHDAAGATTAEAHTTAMSPGNHLDPPALAGPDVTPAATGARGVPVLCYHYFRGRFAPGYAARVLGSVLFGLPALGPREFWTTPAVEFERHLRWLQANDRRVLTLDEVADLVAAGAPLPPNAVVGLWTFDGAGSTTPVPTGPLGDQLADQPRSAALAGVLDGLAPAGGGAVSFTTLRLAYSDAVANYRPGQPNSVLVITSGPHTDQTLDGPGLQDFVASAVDPERRVAINVIDVGEDPDRPT